MKKFKKLWKVWNVVAVIATFLVTFSVVYAGGRYFYTTYGSGGALLSDGTLDVTDWDKLMDDLDNHECPKQDCPETTCPDCNCTEGSYTKAIESKDGSRIIRWNEINMWFYNADGSQPNHLGLTRIAMNWESIPCWTANYNWEWKRLGSYGSNTSLCAVLNTSPCTSNEAWSYYVNVGTTRYNISVSCLNNVSGTPYVAIKVKNSSAATIYEINMKGYNNFPFNEWSIIKD